MAHTVKPEGLAERVELKKAAATGIVDEVLAGVAQVEAVLEDEGCRGKVSARAVHEVRERLAQLEA